MKPFGGFLVSRGVVTPEAVLEALDYQRSTQTPIGRLAVERRILTMKQLFAILDRQLEGKSELFGELALSFGYLTEEQLSELLRAQRSTRQPIGEALVALGHLSRERLEAELAAFHQS